MKWWQLHVKQNPKHVAELNKLGFVWERLLPEWNLVLEALITFSSLNGNLLVPTRFVVPHDSDHYPKATWGMPLGNCVFRIRSRNDFLRGNNAGSRRAQLDGLGFVWDISEHLFQKFFIALRFFKKSEEGRSEEGMGATRALRVPSTFVVPSGEENGWPRELWGYRLGEKCDAVRQKQLYVKNDPERQRALAELGFQWSGNATLGWLEVVHAAAIYSKMHNRNLDVPYHFVVPAPPHIDHGRSDKENDSSITGSDDAWPWPGKKPAYNTTSNGGSSSLILTFSPFYHRATVGLELGTAVKGYSSQGRLLKRELGPNQTRAVGRAGLQLDTQTRPTKENVVDHRRKFMTLGVKASLVSYCYHRIMSAT
jgi:hypothetical protein